MAVRPNWFIALVTRYPALVLLAVVGLAVYLSLGIDRLTYSSSYRIYFAKDNPLLVEFDAIQAEFTKNDRVLLILTPASGEVFSSESLVAIIDTTERAWQTPFSLRVDSVTNFQNTFNEDGDLVVEDLVSDPQSLSPVELIQKKNIALREPALRDRLINDDASVTGIAVSVARPGKDEYAENKEIVEFSRQLAIDIEQEYPGMQVRIAGAVVSDWSFAEATVRDLYTIVPIAFLVMVVAMVLSLRSALGTILTLTVIAFSVIAAMGFSFRMGFPLSPATAAAPTVIMTVAIADCIHLLGAYFYEIRHGRANAEAIQESLRINFNPMFVTSFTTAIGFLSLNFSEIPPFRELGNIVAFGVMVAWLFAVTYVPAVLKLLPITPPREKKRELPVIRHLAEFVIKRRWPLLAVWAVIFSVLLASIPRNELNDVVLHYFDDSYQFRQDTDYASEHLTGMYYIDYVLRAAEEGGINSPDFLGEVEGFANWLYEQPEVRHVSVITDTIKRINRSFNNDDVSYYRLPDTEEEAAQLLLSYEFSLPFGLDLNDQVNLDKSAVRLTVRTRTLSSNEMLDLEGRADQWLTTHTSHLTPSNPTGAFAMFSHISRENIIGMLIGTLISFIVISDLLVFAFGSLPFGILSLLPNLVPAVLGFGIWGLINGQINLSLSLVTSLTLGIIVDDTIHFLSKYLRAQREYGYQADDAIRYTFSMVGVPMIATSVILVAGFLVLACSSFYLNSSMGLLTAIVIAVAVLADLTFLPALLLVFAKKSPEESQFYNPRPYQMP